MECEVTGIKSDQRLFVFCAELTYISSHMTDKITCHFCLLPLKMGLIGSALIITFLSLTGHAEEPEVPQSNPLLMASDKIVAVERNDSVLERHNPFYFAYGNPATKVQLSFKVALIRKVPLYFGYTQLIFWKLNEDSKPFNDATYNPELFYRWNFSQTGLIKSLDIGGFEHNSNGKGGADSRSYNQSYLRLNLSTETERWVFKISPEVTHLYDFDETNRDLREYVGPFSLQLSLIQLFDGWVDKGELTFKVRPGGNFGQRFDRGGYQVSYAFRLGGLDIVPSFYVQYYHGYGENLLNYNQRVDVFRGGFMF